MDNAPVAQADGNVCYGTGFTLFAEKQQVSRLEGRLNAFTGKVLLISVAGNGQPAQAVSQLNKPRTVNAVNSMCRPTGMERRPTG